MKRYSVSSHILATLYGRGTYSIEVTYCVYTVCIGSVVNFLDGFLLIYYLCELLLQIR